MKTVFVAIFTILIWMHNIVNAVDNDDFFQKEKDLKKIGLDIKEIILRHDVEKILKYVANDGIPCIDGMITFGKVKEDLNDENSWLYGYLFSSKMFEKKYKDELYPMGLEMFFKNASKIQIEVSFMKIKGKKISDYACIHYKAENIEHSPEFCFFFKENAWTFADSPYSCN